MYVIGVVADVRQIALDQPVWPGVYLPRMTDAAFAMYAVVQTLGDPLSLAPAIREVVRSADSGVPIDNVQTMSDRVEESMRGRHLSLWLYGIPAVAATIMALAGIYGVTSYAVSQRTQEIGIRMALGAKASDIVKMMLHQGLWLILPGLGIGMVGAYLLSRLLRSIPNMLYDVSSADPLTSVGIPVALAAVTLLACYLPARRASRIDPMLSLRWE
jgi:ABC-type antimicrobial peptide transport system permease subunit